MTESTKKKKVLTLTEYMLHKASAKKIPLSGTFELTPVCNFSCRMCYVRKTAGEVARHPREMMTLEKWLSIAEEARESGLLYLLLTGGEPLLWPDFWTLYEKLNRMGFLVSINTNGSLIDREVLEKLKMFPPKRVNITLYGASDQTYERLCNVKGVFSKVDQAIMGLKNAGIQVKLNCSLTPENAADLEEMIRYAKDRELVLQIASYMFPPIRRSAEKTGINERFTPEESASYRLKAFRLQNGEERYREYLQQILDGKVLPTGLDESCVDPQDGRIRCRAGNASFWITWDGLMMPCGMVTVPQIDLYKNDFKSAWQQVVDICEKMTLSGICRRCPNLELCHACAAMAIAETGEVTGVPVYLCRTVSAMQAIAEQEMNFYTQDKLQ